MTENPGGSNPPPPPAAPTAPPLAQPPPSVPTPPPAPPVTTLALDEAALKALAKERLEEAEILFSATKYNGAAYLCGYAIELAFKSRICRALSWAEYKIKKPYDTFKTHDLKLLLDLSGLRPTMILNPQHVGDWSYISLWGPEYRYEPVGGRSTQKKAEDMIRATKSFLRFLL